MSDMDHNTTVKFVFPADSDAISRIEIVRDFVLEETELYNFELLVDGEVINGAESKKPFNDFIDFIRNCKTDETGSYICEEDGTYVLSDEACENLPDMEEGELSFEQSFTVGGENIRIYLNMVAFFASEIKSFENRGAGIYVEMNDYDGGYYEFDI